MKSLKRAAAIAASCALTGLAAPVVHAQAYSETPAEFAAFLKADVEGYRQTVQAAGIRSDQ